MDRDGVIIEEKNYLSDARKIKILQKVPQAIKLLNQNNFLVIIISNQSGVGRGFFTKEKVEKINTRLINLLSKKGAKIDKVYFCPHTEEDKCQCRKPAPQMIYNAVKEFNIDLKKSYVIGDKPCDIEVGKKCKCKTILVRTGYGQKYESQLSPDYVADNLLEAVEWIMKK